MRPAAGHKPANPFNQQILLTENGLSLAPTTATRLELSIRVPSSAHTVLLASRPPRKPPRLPMLPQGQHQPNGASRNAGIMIPGGLTPLQGRTHLVHVRSHIPCQYSGPTINPCIRGSALLFPDSLAKTSRPSRMVGTSHTPRDIGLIQ